MKHRPNKGTRQVLLGNAHAKTRRMRFFHSTFAEIIRNRILELDESKWKQLR